MVDETRVYFLVVNGLGMRRPKFHHRYYWNEKTKIPPPLLLEKKKKRERESTWGRSRPK